MKRRRKPLAAPANWGGRAGAHPPTGPRSDVVVAGTVLALVVGGIAGFVTGAQAHLRDGLLAQRVEAVERPDWIALEDLPSDVPRAFLAVADPDFEARARLLTGREGSLSRSLVRQVYRLRAHPGDRAMEMVMAPLLELRLSRSALLELYLNRVDLGRDGEWEIRGVGHAAREWFLKEATALTLAEAATLAGLLLPPRLEDPADRPGAVGARRNEVLRTLLSAGWISQEEYGEAVAEPLAFQPGLRYRPMAPPPHLDGEPEVTRIRR